MLLRTLTLLAFQIASLLLNTKVTLMTNNLLFVRLFVVFGLDVKKFEAQDRLTTHPPHSCPATFAYVLHYFSLLFGKKLFSMKQT